MKTQYRKMIFIEIESETPEVLGKFHAWLKEKSIYPARATSMSSRYFSAAFLVHDAKKVLAWLHHNPDTKNVTDD